MNDPGFHTDCFSCARTAELPDLPPRERILVTDGWRVAHAIRTALPGWLVAVTRRHITTMTDLDATEAAELGLLTWRLSRALTAVTGCAKTYVAAFSEAPGFNHLHVHIIPRAEGLPVQEHGPAIFTHLRRPPEEWVPDTAMDEIAQVLTVSLRSDWSSHPRP